MDKKKIGIGIVILIVIIGVAAAFTGNGEEEEELSPAEFEISNLSVTPSEINPGGTVTVSVNVKNTGGKEGSKEVKLTVGGNTKTESVTLASGEETTVSFEISREETGTYDVSISGMSDSFKVIEETEPAEFQISDLSLSPSEAEPEETVTVSVDVKNTGGESRSRTLKLKINGSVEKTTDIILDPGVKTSVSFDVKRKESKKYTVSIGNLSRSFEVLTPAKFEVTNLSLSKSSVEQGEPVSISVDVKNIGEIKGDYTVELELNGKKIDENTVTLSPGASKDVEFSVSKESIGTYKAEIEELSKTFEVLTKISVEYEVTTKFGSAYLKVSISGPEKNYSIQLSGPDKQTVGEGFIYEDDMADGIESADVSMTEYLTERKNPKLGQYTLIVKQSYPEKIVFENSPVYNGWEVSITDVSFETSYDFSGNIDEITVTAQNSGDLPVFVDKMNVIVNGEVNEESIYDEPLPHRETTELSVSTWITNLEKGVHPVTIELYSGENILVH